jgi:hypothetical protein
MENGDLISLRNRNYTGQAMHYARNIESLSRNHFCCGKAVSITYSERVCICALVIRHAKRIFSTSYV